MFDTASVGTTTMYERMRITDTGNVGIGTTAPSEILDINGRLVLAQTTAPGTTTNKLYNVSGNLLWNGINLTGGGSLPSGTTGQTLYNNAGTWTASSNLFHNGTNVGIGTTNPVSTFHVYTSGNETARYERATYGYISYGSTPTEHRFTGATTGGGGYKSIAFETVPGYTMYLNTSGNVGIGTTAPGQALQVVGSILASGGISTGNRGITSDALNAGSVQIVGTSALSSSGTELIIGNSAGWSTTSLYSGTTRVLTTNAGNVGIGTTSPLQKLHIYGDTADDSEVLRVQGNSASYYTDIGVSHYKAYRSPVTSAGLSFGLDSSDGTGWTGTGGGINFFTNNSAGVYAQRFNISPSGGLSLGSGYAGTDPGAGSMIISGNVGIGTTSPGAKLVISEGVANLFTSFEDGRVAFSRSSDGANAGFLTFDGMADLSLSSSSGSGTLSFATNAATRMRIASDGNVGIGTTAPGYKLDIDEITSGNLVVARFKHAQSAVASAIQLENRAGAENSAFDINWALNSSGNNATVGVIRTNLPSAGGNEMYFKTSYGEVMRLIGSGNVGIGTTAPGAKLEVAGQIKITGGSPSAGYVLTTDANGLATWGDISSSGGAWTLSGNNLYPDNTAYNTALGATDAGSAKLYVNGNVGIGTTSPRGTLDIFSDSTDTDVAFIYGFDRSGFNSAALSMRYTRRLNYGDAFFGRNLKGTTGTDSYSTVNTTSGFGYQGMEFRYAGDIAWYAKNGATTANTVVTPIVRMYLQGSSGNLGIGDEEPGTKLSVIGNAAIGYASGQTGPSNGLIINGNVGIGTTSPDSVLVVNGSTSKFGDSTDGIWLQRDGGNIASVIGLNLSGSGYNDLSLRTAASLSNGVYITTAGNVGIGTTNPGARLEIKSSAAGSYPLEIRDTSNNKILSVQDGTGVGRFTILNAGVAKVYFDANGTSYFNSGNVGIGTTSPGAALDVVGGILNRGGVEFNRTGNATVGDFSVSGTLTPTMHFGRLSPTTADSTLFEFRSRLDQNKFTINTAGGGDIVNLFESAGGGSFVVKRDGGDGATLLTVKENNGNVGIGTTNPAGKLDIWSSDAGATNGDLTVTTPNTTPVVYIGRLSSTNNSSIKLVVRNRANSEAFVVDTLNSVSYFNLGNVGIGTTSPGNLLDVVNSSGTASINVNGSNGVARLTLSKGVVTKWYLTNDASTDDFRILNSGAGSTNLIIQQSGNVGIGTTGPGYKLDISGDLNITGNYKVNGVNLVTGMGGSGTANYLPMFATGTTLGNSAIYQSNGNVGIGTTNPVTALEIKTNGVNNGSLKISSDSYGATLGVAAGSNSGVLYLAPTAGTVSIFDGSFNGGLNIYRGAILGLSLQANANSYFNGGNVGIGSTAPLARLQVVGADSLSTSFAANIAGATGTGLIITNAGNVGIGTTSPVGKLDMRIPTDNQYAYFDIQQWATTLHSSRDFNFYIDSTTDDIRFYVNAGSTVAMEVYRNGNVGIGALAPGAKLQVVGADDLSTSFAAKIGGATTTGLVITNNGNVGIGTTSPGAKLDISGFSTSSTQLQVGSLQYQSYLAGNSFLLDNIYFNGSNFVNKYTAPGGGWWTSAVAAGDIALAMFPSASAGTTTSVATAKSLIRMYITNSGNVGIGTTGPGSKLEVVGAGSYTDGLIVRATNANSYSAITMKDDRNSNIYVGQFGLYGSTVSGQASNMFLYNTAGGGLGFYVGSGASPSSDLRMFIASTGNVGIGTTSPATKFEIVGGGIRIPYDQIYGFSNGTNFSQNGFYAASNDFNFTFWNGSSVQNNLVIKNNGNVGIGTTSPLDKLDINGGVIIRNNYLAFTGTDGTKDNIMFSYDDAADAKLHIRDNAAGINRVTFQQSGNVGIGTTSPGSLFQVNGTITGANGIEISSYGSGSRILLPTAGPSYIGNGSNAWIGYVDNSTNWFSDSVTGDIVYRNAQNKKLLFGIDNGSGTSNATMTINAGNVGIGTTAPLYKLDVKSTGTDIARFQGSNSTGCTLSDGGVIACSSDVNLKKNISGIEYGLATLLDLRPVEYNWKSENNSVTKSLGFIAQEVEDIIPKLVSTSSDGLKQLNTIGLVPVAIRAIQELSSSVSGQQIQITGITSNQNKIVEQLTGQLADQNLSVDNKLQLIGASLDALTTEQIEKLKDQIVDNTANISGVSTDLEKLQEQYDTIQDQYLALSEILLVSDGVYDFKQAILKSSGIVSGAFAVQVVPDKPQTIGEAYICPAGFTGDACDTPDASSDGKSVIVENTAVTTSAKIFVTAENDTDGAVWVEKIADNSGFKIHINPATPITEKIKINWWIVEKITEQN